MDQDNQVSLMKERFKKKIKSNGYRFFDLTNNLFENCMNESLIEKQSLKRLMETLFRLSGWPVLSPPGWNHTKFDWKETVYQNRKIGYPIDHFISVSVGVDPVNYTRHMITLDQAFLTLDQMHLTKGMDNKVVSAYFDYMVQVAVILGAEKKLAVEDMRSVLNFEILLAKISSPSEDRSNEMKLYNPMSINELLVKYSSVPWLEYLGNIMSPTIQLNVNETINVRDPNFLMEFEKLVLATPKRVLANYALWRIVDFSVDYLIDEVRNKKTQFKINSYGLHQTKSRSQECLGVALESLSRNIITAYDRKYFDNQVMKNDIVKVEKICNNLIKFIKKIYQSVEYNTAEKTLKDFIRMIDNMVHSDQLLYYEELEEFFDSLVINPGSYLESMQNLTFFEIENSLALLKLPLTGRKIKSTNYSCTNLVKQGKSFNENLVRYPNNELENIIQKPHGSFFDQRKKIKGFIYWWIQETEKRLLKSSSGMIYKHGNYSLGNVELMLKQKKKFLHLKRSRRQVSESEGEEGRDDNLKKLEEKLKKANVFKLSRGEKNDLVKKFSADKENDIINNLKELYKSDKNIINWREVDKRTKGFRSLFWISLKKKNYSVARYVLYHEKFVFLESELKKSLEALRENPQKNDAYDQIKKKLDAINSKSKRKFRQEVSEGRDKKPRNQPNKRKLDQTDINENLEALKRLKTNHPRGGSAHSFHGDIFHLKFNTFQMHSAVQRELKFGLAAEFVPAGKFDDTVLAFNDGGKNKIYLMQLKHSLTELAEIKYSDLAANAKGDFSLLKYLLSHQESLKSGKFQGFEINNFLITNKILNKDNLISNQIKLVSVTKSHEDSIVNIEGKGIEFYNLELDNKKILDVLSDLDVDETLRAYENFDPSDPTNSLNTEKDIYTKLAKAQVVDYFDQLGRSIADNLINDKWVLDFKGSILPMQALQEKLIITIEGKKLEFHDIFINGRKLSKQAQKLHDVIQGELDKKFIEKLKAVKFEPKFLKSYVKTEVKKQLPKDDLELKKIAEKLTNNIMGLSNALELENNELKALIDRNIIDRRYGKLHDEFLEQDIKKIKAKDPKNLSKPEKIFKFLNEKLIEKNFIKSLDKFHVTLTSAYLPKTANSELIEKNMIIKDINDFLKSLVVAENYPNEKVLGEIIEKRISEKMCLLNAELVSNSFVTKMLDWFKEKLPVKNQEGRWLSAEDGKRFLNEIEAHVDSIKSIGLGTIHPEKIKSIGISLKKNPIQLEGVVNFLKSEKRILHFTNQRNDQGILLAVKMNQIIEEISTTYNSNNKDDILELYVKNKNSFVFTTLKNLGFEGVSKIILSSFGNDLKSHNLLIIDCKQDGANNKDFINLSKKLTEILNNNPDAKYKKKIILISGNDNKFVNNFSKLLTTINCDDFKFSDLSDESKKFLKQKPRTVNFNGHDTSINTVISSKSEHLIDFSTVMRLVNNEKIQIGSFVFNDNLISTEMNDAIADDKLSETIKKKANKVIILIEGVPEMSSNLLKQRGISESSLVKYEDSVIDIDSSIKSDKRVFITDKIISGDEFQKFCSKVYEGKNPVYLVSWQNKNFELKSFFDPQTYMKRTLEVFDFNQLEKSYSKPTILQDIKSLFEKSLILSDIPGSGKTTFLKKLILDSRVSNPRKLIMYFDLKQCQDAVSKLPDKFDDKTFLSFIKNSKQLNDHFSEALIESKIKSPGKSNPLLVFEDFNRIGGENDMIIQKRKENFSQFVKFLSEKATVWVSTSPSDLKTLEKSFPVLVTRLHQLNEETKIKYLKRFLKSNSRLTLSNDQLIRLENFVEKIPNLVGEKKIIFREPFDLKIFGQLELKNIKNDKPSTFNGNLDELDSYNKWIETKYRDFSEKYKKISLRDLVDNHGKLAFYQAFGKEKFNEIFSSSDFNDHALKAVLEFGLTKIIKINEENKISNVVFTNKKIADYFLSKTMLRIFSNDGNEAIRNKLSPYFYSDFLIRSELSTTRRFFNSELRNLAVEKRNNFEFLKKNLKGEATNDLIKSLDHDGNTSLQKSIIENNKFITNLIDDNLSSTIDRTPSDHLSDAEKNFIKKSNRLGQNVLHTLALSGNNEVSLKLLISFNEYSDKFGKENLLSELILQQDKLGNTPLHYASIHDNKAILQHEFDKDILKKVYKIRNNFKQTPLDLASPSSFDKILSKIPKLVDDFSKSPKDILYKLLLHSSDEVLKKVLKNFEKLIDPKILQELFLEKNSTGQNLFQEAYTLKKYKTVERLLDFSKKYLSSDMQQEIIKDLDANKKSLLHYVTDTDGSKLMKRTLEICDDVTLTEIMVKKSATNEPVLTKMALKDNVENLSLLLNRIKKIKSFATNPQIKTEIYAAFLASLKTSSNEALTVLLQKYESSDLENLLKIQCSDIAEAIMKKQNYHALRELDFLIQEEVQRQSFLNELRKHNTIEKPDNKFPKSEGRKFDLQMHLFTKDSVGIKNSLSQMSPEETESILFKYIGKERLIQESKIRPSPDLQNYLNFIDSAVIKNLPDSSKNLDCVKEFSELKKDSIDVSINLCSSASKKGSSRRQKRSTLGCDNEEIIKRSKKKKYASTLDYGEVMDFIDKNQDNPGKIRDVLRKMEKLKGNPLVEVIEGNEHVFNKLRAEEISVLKKKDRISAISEASIKRDEMIISNDHHDVRYKKILKYSNNGLMIHGGFHVFHSCNHGLYLDCGLGIAGQVYALASNKFANFANPFYEDKLLPKVTRLIENFELKILKFSKATGSKVAVSIFINKFSFIYKNIHFAVHAASVILDAVSIVRSAIFLFKCAPGKCSGKEIRDTWVSIAFSGASVACTILLYSNPILGLVANFVLILGHGVYLGVSNIIEFYDYGISFKEGLVLIYRGVLSVIVPGLEATPKYLNNLEKDSNIFRSVVNNSYEGLHSSPPEIVGLAGGMGKYDPVKKILMPDYAVINLDFQEQGKKSRIDLKLPSKGLCFLEKNYLKDYENEENAESEFEYYCDQGFALKDEQKKVDENNQFIVYHLNNVINGEIRASDKYNSIFDIYHDHTVIWGSANKINIFNVLDLKSKGIVVYLGENSHNVIHSEKLESEHVRFYFKMTDKNSLILRLYPEKRKTNHIRFIIKKNIASKPLTLYFIGKNHRVDSVNCDYLDKFSNYNNISINTGGGVSPREMDSINNCATVIINPFTTFLSQPVYNINYTLYIESNNYANVADAISIINIKSFHRNHVNAIFNTGSLLSSKSKIIFSKYFNTLSIETSLENSGKYTIRLENYINNNTVYYLKDEYGLIVPIIVYQDEETKLVKDFIQYGNCQTLSTTRSWKDIEDTYKKIAENHNKEYKINTKLLNCPLKSDDNSPRHTAHFGSCDIDIIKTDPDTVFMSGKDGADHYFIETSDEDSFYVYINNESNDLELDTLLFKSNIDIATQVSIKLEGTDLLLIFGKSKQHVIIVNFMTSKMFQHIFFKDINGNAVIPLPNDSNVQLVPFYTADAQREIFLISVEDLKKNYGRHAVIDIKRENILFYREENHLILLSSDEMKSSTNLKIILTDFFLNNSNEWRDINLYSYSKSDFQVIDLEHISPTNYDEDSHDGLIEVYKVDDYEKDKTYEISDSSKLPIFLFYNIAPNNLQAVSMTNENIILVEKTFQKKIVIKGNLDRVGLEFHVGLRPIRFFLNYQSKDIFHLQNQINHASVIYNNMKNHLNHRLDEILDCVVSSNLKNDWETYVFDSKLIFKTNYCSFKMDELNSFRADKYVEAMLSQAYLMSNSDADVNELIKYTNENLKPVTNALSIRIKLNNYLQDRINHMLPRTVHAVIRFLIKRSQSNTTGLVAENLMQRLLTDINDELEFDHPYLSNKDDDYEYNKKKIIQDSDSNEVILLLMLKAYNKLLANNPKLYQSIKYIKLSCFNDLVFYEDIDDVLEDLGSSDFKYDDILNFIKHDDGKININKRLLDLLTNTTNVYTQNDKSDENGNEDSSQYEVKMIKRRKRYINNQIDDASIDHLRNNVVTDVWLKKLSANNERPRIDGGYKDNINNLDVASSLNVNSNLTLLQLLSHKKFGPNKLLKTNEYVPPEKENQKVKYQLAKKILPSVESNDFNFNIQRFIDSYDEQPQWYKDMHKDEVEKIRRKQKDRRDKKKFDEN